MYRAEDEHVQISIGSMMELSSLLVVYRMVTKYVIAIIMS